MTTIVHTNVQRTRFTHLALAALVDLIPGGRRSRTRQLSRAERAAIEASEVRQLAYGYSKSDPGFASDLYAAAARHEGLYAD
ncbi:MAG: hypothetical protein M3O01_04745 [Pseudomonadota bacterium]|nr:hypothetical protein [Pseudomonadota bacterium]